MRGATGDALCDDSSQICCYNQNIINGNNFLRGEEDITSIQTESSTVTLQTDEVSPKNIGNFQSLPKSFQNCHKLQQVSRIEYFAIYSKKAQLNQQFHLLFRTLNPKFQKIWIKTEAAPTQF